MVSLSIDGSRWASFPCSRSRSFFIFFYMKYLWIKIFICTFEIDERLLEDGFNWSIIFVFFIFSFLYNWTSTIMVFSLKELREPKSIMTIGVGHRPKTLLNVLPAFHFSNFRFPMHVMVGDLGTMGEIYFSSSSPIRGDNFFFLV